MEMIVDFPGGDRVDAHFGHYTVKTDQPAPGYMPTDPAPFAVFLASIGTCAGIYVLGFCKSRGLPTDGIKIVQRMGSNPMTGMVEEIELEIQVPPDFPQKYYDALVRSADQCKVKLHLAKPPRFNVHTTVAS